MFNPQTTGTSGDVIRQIRQETDLNACSFVNFVLSLERVS